MIFFYFSYTFTFLCRCLWCRVYSTRHHFPKYSRAS